MPGWAQWVGQVNAVENRLGEIAFDGGTRFLQPGATMRYLPQEPDLSAFANTMEYVEDGLGANDDHYRCRYLLEQLGLTGAEKPANLSGGRGEKGGIGADAGADRLICCCWMSRPTILDLLGD